MKNFFLTPGEFFVLKFSTLPTEKEEEALKLKTNDL